MSGKRYQCVRPPESSRFRNDTLPVGIGQPEPGRHSPSSRKWTMPMCASTASAVAPPQSSKVPAPRVRDGCTEVARLRATDSGELTTSPGVAWTSAKVKVGDRQPARCHWGPAVDQRWQVPKPLDLLQRDPVMRPNDEKRRSCRGATSDAVFFPVMRDATASARPRAPTSRSAPSSAVCSSARARSLSVSVSGTEERTAWLPRAAAIEIGRSTPKPST